MSRSSALILLGVLILLTPFSGLPSSFRALLTVIFGALVLGVGFFLRAKEVSGSVRSQARESAPSPVTEDPQPMVLPEFEAPTETDTPREISRI